MIIYCTVMAHICWCQWEVTMLMSRLVPCSEKAEREGALQASYWLVSLDMYSSH